MTTPMFEDLPPGTRTHHGKKTYYKCAIARCAHSKSAGTDIRLKDPACTRFEKELST